MAERRKGMERKGGKEVEMERPVQNTLSVCCCFGLEPDSLLLAHIQLFPPTCSFLAVVWLQRNESVSGGGHHAPRCRRTAHMQRCSTRTVAASLWGEADGGDFGGGGVA